MLSPKAGWSKEKPNTAWKKKKEASLELYISASSCFASTVPILLYPTGSTFSIQQPVTKHRFRVPRFTEVMLVGTECKNQCIARIGITCEPGMDKPLASIQSCCSYRTGGGKRGANNPDEPARGRVFSGASDDRILGT